MYKHIIFDLDHTLWDFEKNSEETLNELIIEHQLTKLYSIDPIDFIRVYRKTNKHLWNQYNKHQISKEDLRVQRFEIVLEHFSIRDAALSSVLDHEYISRCPEKGHMIEGAKEILDYLAPNYHLHILTNGFEATQDRKLKGAHIDHYFEQVITSETLGIQKPDSRIFDYMIRLAKAKKEECLMIGDNLHTDIIGARRAKIDHVFYNPLQINHDFKVNYQIRKLIELKEIL